MTALVFDSGALIGIEKGKAKAERFVRDARKHGARILIPASALAQVLRPGPRAARLFHLMNDPAAVEIQPLDGKAAVAVGQLLAESKTHDVVDAHVALVARIEEAMVVTSDERDLSHLLPAGWPIERV
jgi:predicted nucleic acid-binding protein